jgi:soluble lytic murein transglycosylase
MSAGLLHTASRLLRTLVVLAALAFAAAGGWHYWRLHRFDQAIAASAQRHGLPPSLLSSLIWRESRFDPACRGPKKEIGLMQVTETAAHEWAAAQYQADLPRADLWLPATNIEVGAWYLARAVQRWSHTRNDPLPFALAEYNAGRSNALRWSSACGADSRRYLDCITYPTTRRYVADILKRYRGAVVLPSPAK